MNIGEVVNAVERMPIQARELRPYEVPWIKASDMGPLQYVGMEKGFRLYLDPREGIEEPYYVRVEMPNGPYYVQRSMHPAYRNKNHG